MGLFEGHQKIRVDSPPQSSQVQSLDHLQKHTPLNDVKILRRHIICSPNRKLSFSGMRSVTVHVDWTGSSWLTVVPCGNVDGTSHGAWKWRYHIIITWWFLMDGSIPTQSQVRRLIIWFDWLIQWISSHNDITVRIRFPHCLLFTSRKRQKITAWPWTG